MQWLRRLRARIKYRRFDDELKRELDVHRAMAEDDFLARGVAENDARRQAARALDNVTLERESARRVWIAAWLEGLWQDLRYAVRRLRRSPMYAFTTLVILVVAIGLNTGVFSVANVLLLKPWSLPAPHELIRAFHVRPKGDVVNVAFVEYRYLSERARSVDLVTSREASELVLDGSEPGGGNIRGDFVSGNYFSALRLPLALGRGFRPEEDQPGRPELVVVLSHAFWQTRLGSDPNAIGQTIGINGQRFAVVGVTSRGNFLSVGRGIPEAWFPFAALPVLFPSDAFSRELLFNPSHCCVELAVRLRPGAARTTATTELSALDRQFRASMLPDEPGDNRGMVVTDTRDLNYPRGGAPQVVQIFALLSAGVFLVLLLACANLGNVQLARAVAQRPEIAIRLSLGASRGRVIRQLMTESLVVALAASAVALVVASLLPGIVLRQAVSRAAGGLTFDPDWALTMFSVSMAVVTAVVTGLTPAFRGTRAAANPRITGHGRLRLRATLLSLQVAISVALLVAAVSMARGAARATTLNPGFNVDGVSIVSIDRRAADDKARVVFNATLIDALDRAGISPVGMTGLLPFGNGRMVTGAKRPDEAENAARRVRFHVVSPGYFAVMGVPLRGGRLFNPLVDGEVVVNEAFARLLWPEGNAVGQRFNDKTVTGVVADAHIDELTTVEPTFYQPIEGGNPNLVVRKDSAVVDRVRAVVAGLDANAVVSERAVSASLEDALQGPRIGAAIAGSLGIVALILAAVGIAGVFSYVVSEHTREIGVRRAIGAGPVHILRLLAHRAGVPLLVGLAAGLALSLLGGPVLSAFLFGLSPRDPATLLGAVAITSVAAILATAMPLLRALRVDPAVTLRHE